MRHFLIIIPYTLQKNGFDTLDGGLGHATTEPRQKKKSKKKSGKRMIPSQQQGHVSDPMTQSTLQQESNGVKNGSYFDNGAASQTGIQSETKTNGAHRTHRHGSKQIPPSTASLPLSKQSNQPTNSHKGRSGLKGLPANQILPFNSDTISQTRRTETVNPTQISNFNSQSAWRKAGLLSQIVTQPAVARRKHTLEIADVANPDSETEVYESTYM